MKSIRNTLIAASLLASLTGLALAQTTPDASPKPVAFEAMEKMHAHRAEHHAKRLAELKSKLKLEAQQESAWNVFAQSMQTPAKPMVRPDHAAMEKLTTPERIDRMQALKVARDAEMQKRADATKTFYATLDAGQKKVFDDATARAMHGTGGRMGHDNAHHGHP